MPYTTRTAERDVDEEALRSIARDLLHQGDLTWAIATLMDEFIMRDGRVSYTTLSSARAAAQDAADEWYRRLMAPYEDDKRRINGDVYRVAAYVPGGTP